MKYEKPSQSSRLPAFVYDSDDRLNKEHVSVSCHCLQCIYTTWNIVSTRRLTLSVEEHVHVRRRHFSLGVYAIVIRRRSVVFSLCRRLRSRSISAIDDCSFCGTHPPPLQFYHLPNHSLSLCVLQSNFRRRNRSRNVDLLWNLTQSNSSTLKRDRKNDSLVVGLLVIQLALSALHCLQIWAFTIDDNEDKNYYFTVWKLIF